jgi:hypothetical protein
MNDVAAAVAAEDEDDIESTTVREWIAARAYKE